MDTDELLILVVVVVLVLIILVYMSGGRRHCLTQNERLLLSGRNLRRTELDGQRLPAQELPELGPSEFMSARYKVVVDDGVGDNIDPLNDLTIAGFKNPAFEYGEQDKLPKVSQTKWKSTKSTPFIAYDDKQLEHVAAELVTPDHRVKIAGKTSAYLPFTGGRSRLNFSSFENSNAEAPFRQ